MLVIILECNIANGAIHMIGSRDGLNYVLNILFVLCERLVHLGKIVVVLLIQTWVLLSILSFSLGLEKRCPKRRSQVEMMDIVFSHIYIGTQCLSDISLIVIG